MSSHTHFQGTFMLGGTMIILFSILGLISPISNENVKPPPSPCHDFYDYVCLTKLEPVEILYPSTPKQYLQIDQYQEYNFRPGYGRRNLFDAINKTLISEWIVEYETLLNGVQWEEHIKKHEQFLSLTDGEQEKSLIEQLESDAFTIDFTTRYYSRLKNDIEILKNFSKPESRKNSFYHSVFAELQTRIKNNIEKYSTYNQTNKDLLIKKLTDTKVLFGIFDYNNLAIWKEAKRAYERRYFQLKQDIIPSQMNSPLAEKLIRITAVDGSVKILHDYMKEFSKRFVFQTVIATPTNDCFNYLQEIHVSVVTRINPEQGTDAVYTDTLFALTHELFHSIYNLEEPTFEIETWKKEKQCVSDRLKELAETDSQNITERWNLDIYTYEDIANMEAVRYTMQRSVNKNESDSQKRQRLERMALPLCRVHKNRVVSHHNPTGIALNVAVSELPNFNYLYNCTPTDRMFVAPENLCESLAMKNDFNLYQIPYPIREETQKIPEEITTTSPPESMEYNDDNNLLPDIVSTNETSQEYTSSSTGLPKLIALLLMTFIQF